MNCVNHLQALKTEIVRKSRDHESLNNEGQALIECSEKDQDVIQDTLQGINKRWDALMDGVSDRVQALEDTSQKQQEFGDALKDLTALLKKYEDKVAAHEALGPAAKDAKHLDKFMVSI